MVVSSYSVVAQHVEDVAQQNQGARSQSVQILGIRHLEGFPQKTPAAQHYTYKLKCVKSKSAVMLTCSNLRLIILGLIITSLEKGQ